MSVKVRPEIAAFAAGLSICYGVEDVPWDVVTAQLHVAGVGLYSATDVEAAATTWIGRNCLDEISAPTVAEAVDRMHPKDPS